MVQLACASLSAEGFSDSGFEKTFAVIPKAGYRFIEFNLWFGRMLLPSSVEHIARRCSETGMRAAAVYCTGLGGNPARIDIDVAHKLYAMEVAERLGCSRVVTGGVQHGRGGTLAAAIETLALIAPVAEQRGLKICLENHHRFTLDTIDDYVKVFEAVRQECVGICIDTGHFDASAVDMDAVIDRLGERVNHIHVKENRAWGVQDFCRFGEGTTRNAHVVERMIERGYDGFITVEQSPQKDRETTVEDLEKPYELFSGYTNEG
ncbi:MAG: TIM barrel protein [Chitinivibrionales bacterium]|nr:TIM barrel protein [Chitinivibrionales bacterium]